MNTKNNVYKFYFAIFFLIEVKAQLDSINESKTYENNFYFNSIGQALFCDYNTHFYETELMNICKIGEDDTEININSLLDYLGSIDINFGKKISYVFYPCVNLETIIFPQDEIDNNTHNFNHT